MINNIIFCTKIFILGIIDQKSLNKNQLNKFEMNI